MVLPFIPFAVVFDGVLLSGGRLVPRLLDAENVLVDHPFGDQRPRQLRADGASQQQQSDQNRFLVQKRIAEQPFSRLTHEMRPLLHGPATK
jgi:hypothetical protein